MITNLLVATDGSEAAICGVQHAVYLVKKLGCRVSLIHVVEFPPFPTSIIGNNDESRRAFENEFRESGRSIIRLSQKPFTDAGIAVNYDVMEGRPADVICSYAREEKFDLIIIGNRGRGKVSRLLLGSVSNEVVQAASCPVLVVRAQADTKGRDSKA